MSTSSAEIPVRKVCVLFVDDEPNIRLTLPAILRMHDFEVTAVDSVAAALSEIKDHRFDVLIADLNIGEPGDGFTVVSAMRRTQPSAVTIIMTGFPAFEVALEAIRSQVDDYVVKPASIDHLVDIIRQKLENNAPHKPLPTKSVAAILRGNAPGIVEQWLERARDYPALRDAAVPDDIRAAHIARVLEELIERLEPGRGSALSAPEAIATEYGASRKAAGCSLDTLVIEISLLRRVVSSTLQEHLLAVDLSSVINEMIEISSFLDLQLTHAVTEYLKAGGAPVAQSFE